MPTDGIVAGVPIPRAINRLQGNELYAAEGVGSGERKFTPVCFPPFVLSVSLETLRCDLTSEGGVEGLREGVDGSNSGFVVMLH